MNNKMIKFTSCPDKSLSHRSVIFGGICSGVSRVQGILMSEDVVSTVNALRACGVRIEFVGESGTDCIIYGVGVGGFAEPDDVLDMGNSGTSTRLLMGLFSGAGFAAFFTGDASLRKRPMMRVVDPLSEMGFEFETRSGKLPLYKRGMSRAVMPIDYTLPVASAQVKSAILLAGLYSRGRTVVRERIKTRDHTENFLKMVGAECETGVDRDGLYFASVRGGRILKSFDVSIPNDPSSVAFIMAAAMLVEGSDVVIPNVCMNEGRTGFLRTVLRMGADVEIFNERNEFEPVADLRVRYNLADMRNVSVGADMASTMIDEYPILAVLASHVSGVAKFEGLHELTAKESNRLKAVDDGLRAVGVSCVADYDNYSLEVNGGGKWSQSRVVECHLDHRIAMSFIIGGLPSEVDGGARVKVDNEECIRTSFPGFFGIFEGS